MLSPMYLPLIKPVWSKSINFSRTLFNLLAITPEPILYTVFSSDIGLQFLRKCLGLSFGKHVMILCFWVTVKPDLTEPWIKQNPL